MGETKQRVSVVICAYTLDRLRDIHDAVNSVLGQSLPLYELIVSVDHNRELLDKLKGELPARVTLVFNDGAKGLSETRNVAIRIATGDIIAFLDDDAVADKDWLQELSRHFENPMVIAVGGEIRPLWLGGGHPGWFPEELFWIVGCTYKGMPVKDGRVRNLIGCNMAFRAQVFKSVGLFSTRMGRINKTQGIGEDSEICLRITRQLASVVICYEPKAIVNHKVPAWRVKRGFLVQRSMDEGYHKSTVKKLCAGASTSPLSTENSYLKFLLFTAVPCRLRRAYQPQALMQAGAIITCVGATGIGYIMGRFRNRRLEVVACE